MKNFVLFALLSVLVFSCSNDKADLKNYIPANAKTLVMINNKAIVDEIKWAVLFGEGKLKFSLIDNALLKLLAENPMEAGVDLANKSYFFTTDSVSCALLPLSSADDLKGFLSANKFEVKEGNNVTTVQAENALVVIEDGLAYIVFGDYNEQNVEPFIASLKDDKNAKLITTKVNSLEAFNSENHIAVYANENFIASKVEEGVKSLYSLYTAMDSGNPFAMLNSAPEAKKKSDGSTEFIAFFNFNNGKLIGKTKQFFATNSLAVRAFQKPSALAKSTFGFDCNKSILNTALSIDLLPFLMAKENEEYKHKLDSVLELNLGFSSEFLASMIDGDAYFSFNGAKMEMGSKTSKSYIEQENEEFLDVAETAVPRLDWDAMITLKDTNTARMGIIGLLLGQAPSIKNSIYHYKSLNTFMFFKGYNVYFTSDSSNIRKILAAKSTDVNAALANYSNGISFNFKDLSKKLPVENISLILPISSMIEKNISTLKYTVQPPKGNVLEGELIIEGSNKDENILLSLLRMMNDFGAPIL